MAQATWYFEKAAECGRQAAATSDRAARARHLRDQTSWTKIAEGIQAEEAAKKLREVK